ncbi:S-layer protein [Methanothermococcus okinawensis]|uniref:S-layer protein n=1 Tax=Methanothermococcus okinawensis (strain DSM 14208 / JCM 11175 / IH1) TaxID=647113 RepID=F8AL67_METOI|nr:S-layer protein [Methanothermococcus okinawensis]AEH06549.1 S-layer protein [Methanothermococcus okinawensis IH1]
MAMSLKKIGAMAIGGAMVASALASGAMAAATTSGDVAGFMKNAVKDGQPNVDVVVGSNAAAMDVVSAADIAAKIGSMCYKTGAVEDGSADLGVHVSSETDLTQDLNAVYAAGDKFLVFTTPKRDYTTGLGTNAILGGIVDDAPTKAIQPLSRLPTLIRNKDIDPDDISTDTSADAAEFLLASVLKNGKDDYTVDTGDLVYGTLAFQDGQSTITKLQQLSIGMEIPLLGENYRIVDTDDNKIYLGKEAYSGNIKEGESYDLGNGYTVKVKSVLIPIGGGNPQVDVAILKDGKEVASKDDRAPFELRSGDVGVDVYDAYQDVGGNYGYASLIITKDVKGYELGKEFTKDWKIYGLTTDAAGAAATKLVLTDNDLSEGAVPAGAKEKPISDKNTGIPLYGLALKYTGDKKDSLKDGSVVDFVSDYASLKFTDDDTAGKLFTEYEMDVSKDATLDVGQKTSVLNADITLNDLKANAQQAVPVTAPIAKLDTEVSLDSADKNLILVGGPVVNKLTKELQDEGKVSIDNNSPATLAVVDNAANGNDVLVVAGGDRDKTREAALDLIKNY